MADQETQPKQVGGREAYEEAGVRGAVGERAIGEYQYQKRLADPGKVIPCEVKVYA